MRLLQMCVVVVWASLFTGCLQTLNDPTQGALPPQGGEASQEGSPNGGGSGGDGTGGEGGTPVAPKPPENPGQPGGPGEPGDPNHPKPPGSSKPLFAGSAVGAIRASVGVPLAGYGLPDRRIFPFDLFDRYPYAHYLKPSVGTLSPIQVKALALKRGSSRLLLLSLDAIGITRDVRDDLLKHLRHLGFADNDVFISATHTHSGPGGLSRNPLWQIIAMDEFLPDVYQQVIADIVATAERAYLSMEEAELRSAAFDAKGIQQNRRGKEGHFDSQANLLLVRSKKGGDWISAVVNFAIHGTAHGPENHKYSGDAPGAIEKGMAEKLLALNEAAGSTRSVPVLFVNGAEGDVAPAGFDWVKDSADEEFVGVSPLGESEDEADGKRRRKQDPEEIERKLGELGREFARQAADAIGSARTVEPSWHVRTTVLDLGEPSLYLRGCVGQGWQQRLIYRGIRPKLRHWMPRTAQIWWIQLGDLNWMTWPGEPTTTLGLALKAIGKRDGISNAWVLGLTNDHLAYFTTREEFEAGGTESCNSFYGHEAGDRILGAYVSLLNGER